MTDPRYDGNQLDALEWAAKQGSGKKHKLMAWAVAEIKRLRGARKTVVLKDYKPENLAHFMAAWKAHILPVIDRLGEKKPPAVAARARDIRQ